MLRSRPMGGSLAFRARVAFPAACGRMPSSGPGFASGPEGRRNPVPAPRRRHLPERGRRRTPLASRPRARPHDRAFAKLDELKEHVIWWETGAQAPHLLADNVRIAQQAPAGRGARHGGGRHRPRPRPVDRGGRVAVAARAAPRWRGSSPGRAVPPLDPTRLVAFPGEAAGGGRPDRVASRDGNLPPPFLLTPRLAESGALRPAVVHREEFRCPPSTLMTLPVM